MPTARSLNPYGSDLLYECGKVLSFPLDHHQGATTTAEAPARIPATRKTISTVCARAVRPAGCWAHGDVHPFNLLYEGDARAAIVDWDRLGVQPRAEEGRTRRRDLLGTAERLDDFWRREYDAVCDAFVD